MKMNTNLRDQVHLIKHSIIMLQEIQAQCTNKNIENFEEVPSIQSKSEPVKKPVDRGYAGMKKGFLSMNFSIRSTMTP